MGVTKAKSVKGSLKAELYKSQEIKESVFLCQNRMTGVSPEERWEEMKSISDLNSRIEKPYIENVISPPEQYVKDFTKEDWEKLAVDYAQKMGYNENQWDAYLHTNTDNPHIHMSVNRIGFEGKTTISDSYIGRKSQTVIIEISKERQWKTAKELNETKANEYKEALLISVEGSKSWDEVKDKMTVQGYHLELSINENGLNGARIMELSEMKRREEREEKTMNSIKSKTKIQKESYISSKEKRFVKPGLTLSKIDRTIKIKDLDNQLSKNREQSKTQKYGRRI